MKRYLWLILPIIVVIALVVFLALGRERARTFVQIDDLALGATFSPDGKQIAFGSLRDGAQIRSVPDGTLVRTFGRGRVNDTSWTPDGQMLVTSGGEEDSNLSLWRAADGTLVRTFDSVPTRWAGSNAISPDGSIVAATIQDGVAMFRAEDGTHIRTHALDVAQQVAFTPDGRLFVAGGIRGVHVYSVETGDELRTLPGWAVFLAVSPDGQYVAAPTGVKDSVVQVWSIATGQPVSRLSHDDGQIHGIAFSPDSRTIATTGVGSLVHWQVADGKRLRRLRSDGPDNLAFSPDGRIVAFASYQRLSLWNVADDE